MQRETGSRVSDSRAVAGKMAAIKMVIIDAVRFYGVFIFKVIRIADGVVNKITLLYLY